jgi:hypothetical protein
MATFTVGTRNTPTTPLVPAKRRRDKGLSFGVLIMAIAFGLWGIERLLIFSLDRETTSYRTKTSEALQQISPDAVKNAEDFYDRSQTIRSSQKMALSGVDILAMLEKTTIPQVRLIDYKHAVDGSVSVRGTTSDYRFVAEQLLRYRSEDALKTMHVGKSERTDTGQVNFEFVVDSQPKTDPNAVVVPQG